MALAWGSRIHIAQTMEPRLRLRLQNTIFAVLGEEIDLLL